MSKQLVSVETDLDSFVDYLAKGIKPHEALILSGYAGKDPKRDARVLLEQSKTQDKLNRLQQGAKTRLKGMTLEKLEELYTVEWERMNTRQRVAFALGMADKTGITEVPQGVQVNINTGQIEKSLPDQIKELADFLRKENLVGPTGATVIDVTPAAPGEVGGTAVAQAEERNE